MSAVVVALLATSSLCAAETKEAAIKGEVKKLQGSWNFESIEYNGKQFEELAKQLKFVFDGDKVAVEGGGEVKKDYAKLVFKPDPSTTPKVVDMKVVVGLQQDLVMEGIYELKGENLRICAKLVTGERPQEFAAPSGSSAFVIVLKRQKP